MTRKAQIKKPNGNEMKECLLFSKNKTLTKFLVRLRFLVLGRAVLLYRALGQGFLRRAGRAFKDLCTARAASAQRIFPEPVGAVRSSLNEKDQQNDGANQGD